MKKSAVIMGSDSTITKKSVKTLNEFGVTSESYVYPENEVLKKARIFQSNSIKNCFGGIIGASCMVNHLTKAISDNIILPVIGIPMKLNILSNGIDAILSTV